MAKKKTAEVEQIFGEDIVFTEDELNLLNSVEPFEDFIPDKINNVVSGFLIKHEKGGIDDFLVNTAGVASDVVCGAINIIEGVSCEAIDITASVAKRGVGLGAGLSRSIVKTFTFGYSKNKRKYANNIVTEDE